MSDPTSVDHPTSPSPPLPVPRREPMFNLPGVIVVSCIVLVGLHALRAIVSVETDNQIVAYLAFMPARVSIALHLASAQVTDAYNAAVEHSPIMAAQIDFLVGDGHLRWWTFLTYALLHGSWAHVGFNCVWLVAFGSAVARRFTALRFLSLMAVAAVAGALLDYAVDVASFQIVIGASAAVSGAMGAATRFVFRPSDEPTRIFDRAKLDEAFRQPALTLRQTFTTKTALVFIIFWFVTNLLFGYFPALGGMGDGPIAWQAHIGGFLVGLLLFPLFDRRPVVAPAAVASASTIDREDTAVLPPGSDERVP